MRRCRAALATLVLVLLTLLVAGPARAGGPTSVLLVSPGTGQTASLYNSDADYTALAGFVGGFASAGASETRTSNESAPSVNVTWLIHDVQVWRVDRVYLGLRGGPWIATQQSLDGSASIWASPTSWHKATNGKQLVSLLDRLGVTPGSGGGDSSAALGGTDTGGTLGTNDVPSVVASEVAAPKQAVKSADAGGLAGSTGLLWGLAGLAVGVLIVVTAMRLTPQFRRLAGRRAIEELAVAGNSDLPVARQPTDRELDWSPTEELSWPAQRN